MVQQPHPLPDQAAAIPFLEPSHQLVVAVVVRPSARPILLKMACQVDQAAAAVVFLQRPELWERQRPAKATMVAQVAQVARLHLVAAVAAARVDALALTEAQQRVAAAALAHRHPLLDQQ